MIQIPLQAIPNQTLSINLNDNAYDILLRACGTGDALVMSVDLTINNDTVLLGQRIVPGAPLIPYLELTDIGGNFILLTNEGDLPDYNEFQISQYLIFATQAEINASA